MNAFIDNNPIVWVIDDDQSIRWILQRALSNSGFHVSAFETASNALMQFKRAETSTRPSLIVSDFRMPGINGFELLRQIKNIDASIPIIIMTAYSDLDTTVESYQEGAFEYLAKPFDIDDAIELVKKAYQKTQIGDDPSLHLANVDADITQDWKEALKHWAQSALARGESGILTTAITDFEKTLIECALAETKGKKQEAAKRLGWGRNTLTRKLKEHY